MRHDNATKSPPCPCAVAVKSGDDVTLINRCTRDDKQVTTVTTMFLNGDLTPNTRVFQFDEGRTKQVVGKKISPSPVTVCLLFVLHFLAHVIYTIR